MRQFVGGFRAGDSQAGQADTGALTGESSVRDLLVSVAPLRLRAAAKRLDAAELVMMERDDETAQMRYAAALAEWGDAGGYDAEVLWDACCLAALGIGYEQCRWREVGTLSGGEQKRLVLEALLRGPADVLLLDEPDNYLDVPAKRWLEQQLATTGKTVLLVSHDRELLANCAQRIVTVEDGSVWVHGGGFATYVRARQDRSERLDELRRRWDEEHEKIKQLVRMYRQKASYNDAMASRLQAAETRLRRFEEAGPPELAPREQNVRMRLRGGRTGKRAIMCENLELTGLTRPFSTESGTASGWPCSGPRIREVVVPAAARRGGRPASGLGAPRGQGRARLVRSDPRPPRSRRPVAGRDPHDRARAVAQRGDGRACSLRNPVLRAAAVSHLVRGAASAPADLLLELAGSTLLLLDEPTDNLDLSSAGALQEGLESYQGTVLL